MSQNKFNNFATSADCTHTPNFNAFEQSAAELLRFKSIQFGRRGPQYEINWKWILIPRPLY